MTRPIKIHPTRQYTDNDEAGRARAKAIQQMGKAYEAGGAQSDNSYERPDETANAATDYDLLKRATAKSMRNAFLRKRR